MLTEWHGEGIYYMIMDGMQSQKGGTIKPIAFYVI